MNLQDLLYVQLHFSLFYPIHISLHQTRPCFFFIFGNNIFDHNTIFFEYKKLQNVQITDKKQGIKY